MRKCTYCEEEIPKNTEHIKGEDWIACENCFEESTMTNYYVGGEFVGTDEDEIIHVYDWEDDFEEENNE